MLNVDLSSDLKARLTAIATQSGKTEAYHIEAALAEYIEDQEDLVLAEKAMRNYDPTQNLTLRQMKQELGLDS